ncbi:MAG: Hsp20/alpha crystallin family protein [Planctomycetota bacterium]|nr:Hsp20/alpha crystallin family protein [Planctomycetota bacterium]
METTLQKSCGTETCGTETAKSQSRPTLVPKSDIFETEEGLSILAEMPGVDEKHISLDLDKGVLTIKGEVVSEEHPDHNLSYWERRDGNYQRSFRLSDEIDTEKITASIKDGILKIDLPKAAESKPRKIAVKAK